MNQNSILRHMEPYFWLDSLQLIEYVAELDEKIKETKRQIAELKEILINQEYDKFKAINFVPYDFHRQSPTPTEADFYGENSVFDIAGNKIY